MKVEIAVQTHNFQRRLCWMLASLLQQDMPRGMSVSAAVACMRGNGEPGTEAVAEVFNAAGLPVKLQLYDDLEVFQYRGLVRNRQAAETDADWILFADSDMCYPVDFCRAMHKQLRGPFKDSPHCLHSQRYSTELAPTEALVDDTAAWAYPCVVPAACDRIAALPGKLKTNIGAGYMHLANVALLRADHQGKYQLSARGRDRSWRKGQKARSDIQFRRRLGARAVPLPVQYHIQHRRDSEAGCHLEIQR